MIKFILAAKSYDSQIKAEEKAKELSRMAGKEITIYQVDDNNELCHVYGTEVFPSKNPEEG